MSRKFSFTDENGENYPTWENKKLGEVVNCLDHKRIPLSSQERVSKKGIVPYYGATQIVDYIDDFIFDEDLVLLGEDGVDFDNFLNKPIAQYVTGKSWVNNHSHVFKACVDKITTKFMYYSLVHKDVTKHVVGSGRLKLNKSEALKINLPLPSLPEQEKIAEFFSALDERIDLIDNKVKLLKERKKGYLQRVFSGELAFTDDNGERYPAWEQKKLGEVATLKMGFTPSTDNTDFWQGDIPWLSIAGFNSKYIENGTKFISEEALGKKKVLPKGSLVMSFKLTLGKLAILKNPMVTNEAICSFEWRSGITTSEFAFYALSSLKFEKFANRAAAGLTLNDKTLKLLPISLPSLPEQKKIADFFSALDEEIELNENKLAFLKEQKKGYLQGIFG